MLWLIFVLLVIIFLVWSEDRSQNCKGKPCQHSPPPVKEGDSPQTIIDKTIYAISLHHTTVDWRRSVLATLMVTLLLFFLMQPTIPYGSDFVIVATFLALAYYLASSWFVWSWSNPVDQQIEKALIALRKQSKSMELKERFQS